MKKEIVELLSDPEFWGPKISEIARESGKSVEIVKRQYKKLVDQGKIELQISFLSDLEAIAKKRDQI